MENKVTKFKKPFQFHTGIIVFGFLLLYLIILTISFAFQKHTSIYEVQVGELSTSYHYRALALREEKIIHAKKDGYITYFAKESSKVGAKSLVYALNATENLYSDITSQSSSQAEIDLFSKSRKEELLKTMDDYSYNYSNDAFFEAYSFKETLNQKILEALAANDSNAKFLQGMSAYFAKKQGIVLYSIDGMEELTTDSLTEEHILGSNYQPMNLSQRKQVKKDDPVYKVITSESWDIITPVDDSLMDELKEHSYVMLHILSDDYKAEVPFEIFQNNGKNYLKLSLSSGCIRYATSRYLDIELLVNETSGYKIPNSSIIMKDLIRIPRAYLTQSGSKDGCLKVSHDKQGTETISFVAASAFDSDDDYFYIHSQELLPSDVISMPGSNQRITLNDTVPYPCVYCVNKGYAVLKRVLILTNTEDYSIIDIGTSHGISNYDHIALDGTQIEEGEMVH